jgi:Na+(H+)/acetate symporter ActP
MTHLPLVRVRDRLSWQRPKAAICGILLIISSAFTVKIWRRLLEQTESDEGATGLGRTILVALAILGIPTSLFLMILAIVNTQASLAPLVITFGQG